MLVCVVTAMGAAAGADAGTPNADELGEVSITLDIVFEFCRCASKRAKRALLTVPMVGKRAELVVFGAETNEERGSLTELFDGAGDGSRTSGACCGRKRVLVSGILAACTRATTSAVVSVVTGGSAMGRGGTRELVGSVFGRIEACAAAGTVTVDILASGC